MICPNCNTPAEGNYCANCGQKTHLHKETFWHLVGHFMGHYFHWESKFWHTFKVLITKPGALTLAYHNKQRMRFVPPINLYIFTSVFFFILVNSTVKVGNISKIVKEPVMINGKESEEYKAYPSPQLALGRYNFSKIEELKKKSLKNSMLLTLDTTNIRSFVRDMQQESDQGPPLYKMFSEKFMWRADVLYVNYFFKYLLEARIKKTHNYFNLDQPFADFATSYFHLFPKFLFLLMPLLGLFIQLGFKREGFLYVDHAIMSIHVHIFWFLSMAIHFIVGCFMNLSYLSYLGVSAVLIPGIYFLMAMRNGYGFSWLRTTIIGTLIWFLYLAIVVSFSVIAAIVIFRYLD